MRSRGDTHGRDGRRRAGSSATLDVRRQVGRKPRVGDDVAAEVFLGPDPAGEINEWGAIDGRVVAIDGEHLDVRAGGRVVTVHRAFVTGRAA